MTRNLTYISHSDSFKVWCKGYTHYGQHRSPDGVLRSRVDATCTDQNGAVVYLEAYFVDRGEPGIHDRARIFFTRNPAFASDPAGSAFFDADLSASQALPPARDPPPPC